MGEAPTPHQDIRLRGNAAMAIGLAGLESPLIKILEDENQNMALRADAATALGFTIWFTHCNSKTSFIKLDKLLSEAAIAEILTGQNF